MSKIKKPTKPKNKIKDNFRILNDAEHVRLRPGMYLPNKDYCVSELIDNGVDILLNNDDSYMFEKKLITCKIDKDGVITVTDSAGALPTRESEEVPGCSVAELCMSRLKAGTKFEDGVKSAGLNGVGASCVNFLSEWFNVEIYKDGVVHQMMFEKGVIKEKLHIADKTVNNDSRMTLIQCKPDPEIWADKDDFSIKSINNRMKQICYLNPELTIKVDLEYGEYDIHEVYNYPEGVKTYVEELIDNKDSIHSPWFLTKTIEMNNGKSCEASIAFAWTQSYSDTVYAFTNNVINTDGKSSNITGFKRGIAAAVKECFEAEYPKSKTQIIAEDTREGMVAVVSVKVPDPNYIGQGKDYLNMPAVASAIYNEIKEFCTDQFDKLPNEKDNILNKVIESNKIREAAHKAKEAAKKNKSLTGGKVEGLTKCISKNPYDRFIWFVEGDSAGGSAKQARDKEVDAILPVFGKIPNVYDRPMDKIISSDKIKIIINALGCGIGDEFNIENLAYHNIVILTDADSDGEHIRCLYLTFFYKYMKPLLENGHIYVAEPPLYAVITNPRTKKEQKIYAWNKEELDDITKDIKGKYEIQRYKGLGEMNYKELKESTMDKNTRRLVQITVENMEEVEKTLSTCMYDKDIKNRKTFLIENKPEREDDALDEQ